MLQRFKPIAKLLILRKPSYITFTHAPNTKPAAKCGDYKTEV